MCRSPSGQVQDQSVRAFRTVYGHPTNQLSQLARFRTPSDAAVYGGVVLEHGDDPAVRAGRDSRDGQT